MNPKWHDRLFEVLFAFVLLAMPWLAAIIIGGGLTWYNFVVLHHTLWHSMMYGYWLPLLLLGFNYLFYWHSPNTRNEMGCAYSVIWLILFLILAPMVVKAHHKINGPGSRKQGTVTAPRNSQESGPAQHTA